MLLRVVVPDRMIIVDGEAYECTFTPHENDLVAVEYNDEEKFVYIDRCAGESHLLRGKALKPLLGVMRAYKSAWEHSQRLAKAAEERRAAELAAAQEQLRRDQELEALDRERQLAETAPRVQPSKRRSK